MGLVCVREVAAKTAAQTAALTAQQELLARLPDAVAEDAASRAEFEQLLVTILESVEQQATPPAASP